MTTIDDQKLADLKEISELMTALTIKGEAYAKKYKIKESSKTTFARKYLRVCDFLRKSLEEDNFNFDDARILLKEIGEI